MRRAIAGIALGLALVLAAAPAAAAEKPTSRIGDHVFGESDLVPLPIPSTNLMTSLGAGGAPNVDVEVFEWADSIPTRTIDGSLTYLTLRLGYQQAVNDWLAPWASINVAGRIGTNSVSIVSEGVPYQYSWELGWLIKVREWEHARLGATLNLWNSTWGVVDLGQWLRDAIAAGGIDETNELYRTNRSLTGGAGLRYAHAVNATFGWAAAVEGGVGEPPNRLESTRGFFRGGVIGDFDLAPARGVPIGIALGYRYESFPGLEPNVTWRSNQGLVRIGYTGREEFGVALETQLGSVPLSNGQSTVVIQTRLTTRYYF